MYLAQFSLFTTRLHDSGIVQDLLIQLQILKKSDRPENGVKLC